MVDPKLPPVVSMCHCGKDITHLTLVMEAAVDQQLPDKITDFLYGPWCVLSFNLKTDVQFKVSVLMMVCTVPQPDDQPEL